MVDGALLGEGEEHSYCLEVGWDGGTGWEGTCFVRLPFWSALAVSVASFGICVGVGAAGAGAAAAAADGGGACRGGGGGCVDL